MECKNFEGSEERRVNFHEDHNIVHIRQAANAAISGAVGSSSYRTYLTPKKRKSQETFSGKLVIDQNVNMTTQYQQVLSSLHS